MIVIVLDNHQSYGITDCIADEISDKIANSKYHSATEVDSDIKKLEDFCNENMLSQDNIPPFILDMKADLLSIKQLLNSSGG